MTAAANLRPEAQPGPACVSTDRERRCSAVARRLLGSWALALGSPADVLDSAFGDRPSTLVTLVRAVNVPIATGSNRTSWRGSRGAARDSCPRRRGRGRRCPRGVRAASPRWRQLAAAVASRGRRGGTSCARVTGGGCGEGVFPTNAARSASNPRRSWKMSTAISASSRWR